MHLVATRDYGFDILGAMKKKAINKMAAVRSLPTRGNGSKTKRRDLADRIIALIEEARGKVAKAANVALVYTYYDVGRMIVEDEQGGKKRAEYGKAQLATLSRRLTDRFGKGWSVENLKLMRRFFVTYSNWVKSVYRIGEEAENTTSGATRVVSETGEGIKAFLIFFRGSAPCAISQNRSAQAEQHKQDARRL